MASPMSVTASTSDADLSVSVCDCAKLTENDIPGAILKNVPSKCKATELKIWLQCRGQRVKSKQTKAELCIRVERCLNESLPIQDPIPGTPYLREKQSKCSICQINQTINSAQEVSKEVDNCVWSRSSDIISNEFSYIKIFDYSRKSGKKVNDYVEKPIDRGYCFFYDGYIFDILTSKKDLETNVKCKCYRSMKKNEEPHKVNISLNITGTVLKGRCSCVAGSSGFCNHVFGLLYSIDHCKKMKLTEFCKPKTCTEKPSEWTKARTEGIHSQPVMDLNLKIVKPKYCSSSSGIKCSLYEARSSKAKESVSDTLEKHIEALSIINPLFGICQTSGNHTDYYQKTKLGVMTPQGSPLSYQLSFTEGNFSVVENFDAQPLKVIGDGEVEPPKFPWGEVYHPIIEQAAMSDFNINITAEAASDLEKVTKLQYETPEWFKERKYRLTASKFGAIQTRKKNKDTFVRNLLKKGPDLSKVASIKFGRENEDVAVKHYYNYMLQNGYDTKVYKCGLVVNPKYPWLAASPDRIVYNKTLGYGLLEVKCSYSKRNLKIDEACEDSKFFCSMDRKFTLKTTHEYYSQIQGQLGVACASYCDFILYTSKGLGIQRILFDSDFWRDMSNKLKNFYSEVFAPVIKSDLT